MRSTALLSGNKSVVWTAGHCVNDGAGTFHTNWAFVPAYADGSRPYGTWTARSLLTTAGWNGSGDFSYDNGAAIVNLNGGQALREARVDAVAHAIAQELGVLARLQRRLGAEVAALGPLLG